MECSYGCLSNFDLPPSESPSGRNKLTVPPAWFADYNAVAPHSALGYQSPHQYRTTMLAAGPKC